MGCSFQDPSLKKGQELYMWRRNIQFFQLSDCRDFLLKKDTLWHSVIRRKYGLHSNGTLMWLTPEVLEVLGKQSQKNIPFFFLTLKKVQGMVRIFDLRRITCQGIVLFMSISLACIGFVLKKCFYQFIYIFLLFVELANFQLQKKLQRQRDSWLCFSVGVIRQCREQ